MTPAEPILVSLACDYITGVALEETSFAQLRYLANTLFHTELDFGNQKKSWGMSGFKGWSCGHVQLGVRDHEFICRLGGESAARNWKQVHACATNISRFDMQATVKYPRGPTSVIDAVRAQALAHAAAHDDVPVVRWIADNRGGYTLYLGARESNAFARVYDKFAREKTEHFRSCVRYEVQYNSRLARIVTNTLARESSPVPHFAAGIRSFLDARGVDLDLPYEGQLTFCSPRNASDVDRKLIWLAKAVRPSVLSCIAAGRGEEALRALGLVDESVATDSHMNQTSTNEEE
jgi:DNA relaxase NicK